MHNVNVSISFPEMHNLRSLVFGSRAGFILQCSKSSKFQGCVFPPLWEAQQWLFPLTQVIYLRRFKHLRSLNLKGNPLCDDERYTLFVVAHHPDLMYLDYKLVSDATVSISASPACEIGELRLTEH